MSCAHLGPGTSVPDQIRSGLATMPLRRRLVLGLLTVMAVTLVVVASASFFALRAWNIEQIDAGLMQPKSQLYLPSDHDVDNTTSALQSWTANGATLVILAADGTAVTPAQSVPGGKVGRAINYSTGDAAAFATVPTARDAAPVTLELDSLGTSRAVAVPAFDDSRRPIVLVAVTSLSRADKIARQLLLVELIAMALALLISGLVATWFIRRSLRPLQDVAATASEVARLPLERGDVTIPARVPDPIPTTEVGQVGLAVNAMLDHVENSLRRRADTEDRLRRFVSDAGHELRTPLSVVRGYAELMRRGAGSDPEQSRHAAERIEAAGSRMGMLVEDLLLLASLDEERPLSRDSIDLDRMVDEAIAEAATAGPDHEWAAERSPVTVLVVGDGVRLHQAVANLLSNARTHTPAGTQVTASVSVAGDIATIEVRDDGPGFPPDLLPRVTERFSRGDASRSRATGGSGLGLSIVKAVAEAHGGSLSVDNFVSGGAVIRLSLPLSGPPLGKAALDRDSADASATFADPAISGRVSPADTLPSAVTGDESDLPS